MTKLHTYELEFDKAYEYFFNLLHDANELSSSLLDLVNFKNGSFFTLLPDDANLGGIYDFVSRGMAHGVRENVHSMVFEMLRHNKKLSCIIDAVSSTYKDGYSGKLFDSNGLFISDEIYYLINYKSATTHLISKCFYTTDAIWHSLCVLTEADFSDVINKELTLVKIREICLNTKLIIVGAYDGEGHIFWKPKVQILKNNKHISHMQISSSTGSLVTSAVGGLATNTMINSMSFGDSYTSHLTPCIGKQSLGQLLYGNTTYNRMFKSKE